jgi:hypothetical protein
METPFRLIQGEISHDTLKAAKTLVKDAESGDLLGFSIATMYRQGGYQLNATGEAYKSPTFAIGTLVMLIYKLIKLVISRQKKL